MNIYHYSQFLDDNDDGESQKFLSNGMMKKKKYEEYDEEYVRACLKCNVEVYLTDSEIAQVLLKRIILKPKW